MSNRAQWLVQGRLSGIEAASTWGYIDTVRARLLLVGGAHPFEKVPVPDSLERVDVATCPDAVLEALIGRAADGLHRAYLLGVRAARASLESSDATAADQAEPAAQRQLTPAITPGLLDRVAREAFAHAERGGRIDDLVRLPARQLAHRVAAGG